MIKKKLTIKIVWMWDIWILIVNVVCWFDGVCSDTDTAFSEESPSMNQTPNCETFGLEAYLYKNLYIRIYSYQASESYFSPFIPWVSGEKRLREFRAALFLPAQAQGLWSPSVAKHSATGRVVFTLFSHGLRCSTRVIIRWAARSWMLDPTLVFLCFIHQRSVNCKQRTSSL